MTPTASTAATQGAPQTPGSRHQNGVGEPVADPMSLQALFAALLANGAPGTPTAAADAAGGKDLPESPAGLPPAQAAMQELLSSATAAADAAEAAAAFAALLQGGDALQELRPWAEGQPAGADGAGGTEAPGSLLDAAAALLAAQESNAGVTAAAAAMSPVALSVEPVPAPQATAGTVRFADMGGSAPVPPALAIALAAIARGDAAFPGSSAGEAAPPDGDRVPLPMSPLPSSQPAPPTVASLQAAGGLVAQGAEPIAYPHAMAAGASGELQQALREALTRTGIATATDGRTGIDSPPDAMPMTAGPIAATPAGGERPTPVWTLSTPMHNAQQWAEEVGDRIRWMAGNRVQSAELSITPPDLGAIKIRISVHQDHMSISFSSPSAQVRETLEEAIPRLRDLMSGSGYDAVDVDVSHDRPGEGGDDGARPERALAAGEVGGGAEGAPEVIETPIDRRSGGVDLYA